MRERLAPLLLHGRAYDSCGDPWEQYRVGPAPPAAAAAPMGLAVAASDGGDGGGGGGGLLRTPHTRSAVPHAAVDCEWLPEAAAGRVTA